MNIERIGEISFVPELLNDRPRLLQVGALSSDDAAEFLRRYPLGQAAICEADPENFAALRPMPRLSLLNVAVECCAGTADFYHINGHPDGGSLFPPPQHGPEKYSVIKVQTLGLTWLMLRLGWPRAEILALDCEGAECAILSQAQCRPDIFQQISVEFHAAHGYYTEARRQELTDGLCSKGYALAPGLKGNYALFVARSALFIVRSGEKPMTGSQFTIRNSKLPLVSCLCATYGRFARLREAIGYFLAQDYPAKELIVLNNHPTPIRCDLPGVTVVNMPGHPDLGSCRRTLLKLAQGEIFNTWDDDDRWLPWHLSQGVARLLASGRSGWKPARSWRCDKRSGKPVYDLFSSGCIASALVKADFVRRVGYVPSSGDDDIHLLQALTGGPNPWAVEEMGWRASYIYTWTGVNNASAILQNGKPLAARDALWKSRNADAGDGKPLQAADVRPLYEELLEMPARV